MAVSSQLHIDSADLCPEDVEKYRSILVIGRAGRIRSANLGTRLGIAPELIDRLLERARPGDAGATSSTLLGSGRLILGVLPDTCSRHNSPSRAWVIPTLARAAEGDARIVLVLDNPTHAGAAVRAVARAFPRYDASTSTREARNLSLRVECEGLAVGDPLLGAEIEAVREAARLTDMPTSELDTSAFVEEARAVAQRTGATLTVIAGEDLEKGGFGGLWGVGKAARNPPALVALDWDPPGAKRSVAWVGKGIVYDTGGLSLKDKNSMPGMKGDMAGAAAVLAAFELAVKRQVPYRLCAVLCLAENAVGPDAMRPDDILRMRSGKTVEVNNTDAEGRLVLADGLAWVCAARRPDMVVDMATLTGAALVATGKVHAALYCNDEELEALAVTVGRREGEPCHALPYAPELYKREFRSVVADMRNSVKNRNNAQSSCAGQFIAMHLPEPAPAWLHVDIAGTATDLEGRATGTGIGLLLGLGDGQVSVAERIADLERRLADAREQGDEAG